MADECLYSLTVAGVTITIQSAQPLTMAERFLPFLTDLSEEGYQVIVSEVPFLPKPAGELLYRNESYEVFQDEKHCVCRWYYNALHDDIRFARTTSDWANRRISIEYIPEEKELLSAMINCYAFSGWETMLLRERRLLLHASCINSPVGGLLFSGVSGIGKSTQAELWCRYAGASMINGDRPALYRGNDGWYGCGSPYAGSSHCFVNEHHRIRAIVMLRQAPVCHLRVMKKTEAFRSVFAQITVTSWDPSCVSLACDLVEQLVSEVVVYEYACTPDETAVHTLLTAIQKDVNA